MANTEQDKRIYRKTCRRYNIAGHAHLLTFSCFGRQPFLTSPRTCQWLLASLDHARVKYQFDLWAYVVMPEHVHLLIFPREAEYSISSFLKAIKQPVARKAVAFIKAQAPQFLPRIERRRPDGGLSHHFWQRGGGYDSNLTKPETVQLAVDYLHGNPVRRGLCGKPSEWPWSSAAEWCEPGSGPLAIDGESFPRVNATVVRKTR